jgi:hypothetical protein
MKLISFRIENRKEIRGQAKLNPVANSSKT